MSDSANNCEASAVECGVQGARVCESESASTDNEFAPQPKADDAEQRFGAERMVWESKIADANRKLALAKQSHDDIIWRIREDAYRDVFRATTDARALKERMESELAQCKARGQAAEKKLAEMESLFKAEEVRATQERMEKEELAEELDATKEQLQECIETQEALEEELQQEKDARARDVQHAKFEVFAADDDIELLTAQAMAALTRVNQERVRRQALKEEALKKARECAVCMDKPAECSLQCGHVFCLECAQQVQKCPSCRAFVITRTRVFI